MPRNPKIFIHGRPYEIGFRTESGLPLVATPYMKTILRGIFAAAQALYPTTICDYIVMANHMHMIIVVENPSVVDDFIGYIKRESAIAINKLLGRTRHTVWCSGYDSPMIADPETIIRRKTYFYTNPQAAHLVDTIEEYPNLSSWEEFCNGASDRSYKRIPRYAIPALPKGEISFAKQYEIKRFLLESASAEHALYIEPDAWMRCFSDTAELDPEVIKAEVLSNVRENELKLRKEREGFSVLGARRIQQQDIAKEYVPKKHGKKMWVLAATKALRVAFVKWAKEYVAERDELKALYPLSWITKLPPGFIAPGGYLRACINPDFLPIPV